MGNEASYQMGMATNFDAEEIKRLGKRFKKLDLVNKSTYFALIILKTFELLSYSDYVANV